MFSFVVGAGFAALEPVKFGWDKTGYISGPVGGKGVIVIQEWWGVTDQIKAHAEYLERRLEGNVRMLIPYIYKGKVGVDAEEASHLMNQLNFTIAVQEIAAAASYLKNEGSPAVGVVGFCMGGALALGSLAKSADITCGSSFYGVNAGLFEPHELGRQEGKWVQAHFGELDTMVGFADTDVAATQLSATLDAAGNDRLFLYTYPGVGHAFMNADPAPFKTFEQREKALGFPAYSAAAATRGWNRLTHFFGLCLDLGLIDKTGLEDLSEDMYSHHERNGKDEL